MVAFTERPLCYQMGMLLLLVGTAVFGAGVALPWWAQTRGPGTDHVVISHSGLWQGCSSSGGEDTCSAIDAPNWFKAVQVLQGLSLAGMLVACAHAIFTNCCLDHATFSRTMEITAGVGGMLGIVSGVLYVAKTSHIIRQSHHASYSWAFAMDLSACVFVTFIAAIIALTNSRYADDVSSHVIVEEGGRYLQRRAKRPGWWREAKQRGWEMEMIPVPTSSLSAPPSGGGGTGVIVMQNNYSSADSQRPAGDGSKPGGGAAVSVSGRGATRPCPPPVWGGHVASGSTGHEAAYPGHSHHCRNQSHPPQECPSECPRPPPPPPPFQSSACSCTKPSVGASPGLHCGCASSDPERFPQHFPAQPSLHRCGCSGVPTPPQPEPQCCHNSVELQKEKCPANIDRNLESFPRAVASAPPLSLESEIGQHLDYTTDQYFVTS
ncbi:uncharacterized protein LOC143294555 [Babylonia areolata]|uniref:uncharacterized protein LOC143294555 n=1 Tax=Babylonia areolata TaxID=304850 RepID=UPI003FD21590